MDDKSLIQQSCTSHQYIHNYIKMFKTIAIFFAVLAVAAAKPSVVAAPLVAAAPAPLVAAAPAAVVTASSSQYYHRINNGLAAYVAAPAAYVAPAAYTAAAPYFASAPYFAAPAASYVAY